MVFSEIIVEQQPQSKPNQTKPNRNYTIANEHVDKAKLNEVKYEMSLN